tara:strand:+ start:1656 stop:2375 length:720 start_codon:yes stop_codon:yes gene_type:complete
MTRNGMIVFFSLVLLVVSQSLGKSTGGFDSKSESNSKGVFLLCCSNAKLHLLKEQKKNSAISETIDSGSLFWVKRIDEGWYYVKRKSSVGFIELNQDFQIIRELPLGSQRIIISSIFDKTILELEKKGNGLIELEYDYSMILDDVFASYICASEDTSLFNSFIFMIDRGVFNSAEYNANALCETFINCPSFLMSVIDTHGKKNIIDNNLYELAFFANEYLKKDTAEYDLVIGYYNKYIK